MASKNYTPINRKPSHAGEILRHGYIEQHSLSVEVVAQQLGISVSHLSQILEGKKPITKDMANRLESVTETPASQWLAIQKSYDTCSIETALLEGVNSGNPMTDDEAYSDTKKYSLTELKAMREAGLSKTQDDAPVYDVEESFWNNAND